MRAPKVAALPRILRHQISKTHHHINFNFWSQKRTLTLVYNLLSLYFSCSLRRSKNKAQSSQGISYVCGRAWGPCTGLSVITIVNFYFTVWTQLSIDRSVNVGLRIFILGVPGKVLWFMCHSIHFLTEVGVSLYQHKRWASWEANGFCGISIRTAAIFDASVMVVITFRKRATSFVIVIVIFIIPTNVCLLEICATNIYRSITLKLNNLFEGRCEVRQL